MSKRSLAASCTVWFLGLIGFILIDFMLRHFAGEPYEPGVTPVVWYSSHFILALASLALLLYSLHFKPTVTNILIFFGLIVLGATYYLLVMWVYVIETGIDSV